MPSDNVIDSISEIKDFEDKLKYEIYKILGIKVNLSIVAPKTIGRTESKAVKVIDNRNL